VLQHPFLAVPTQALVAQFIGTFKDFPPRQRPSSFSIDQIMDQMFKQRGRLPEMRLAGAGGAARRRDASRHSMATTICQIWSIAPCRAALANHLRALRIVIEESTQGYVA